MNSIFQSAKNKAKHSTQQKTGGMLRGFKSTVRKAKAKLNKAESTPEEPEIIGALERLKATKNEIQNLSYVVRNLYDSRIVQTTHQIDLSHQLRNVRQEEQDGFSQYCAAMGSGLSRLESIYNEYCTTMKEEFVVVLEKFRDEDVQKALGVKDRYKDAKNNYDIALTKLQAANSSNQAQKMQQAANKRDETSTVLQAVREEFKTEVTNLELKKNTELLAQIQDHWEKYIKFVNAQSNALNNNNMPEVDASSYLPKSFKSTKGEGNMSPNIHSDDEDEQQNNDAQYSNQSKLDQYSQFQDQQQDDQKFDNNNGNEYNNNNNETDDIFSNNYNNNINDNDNNDNNNTEVDLNPFSQQEQEQEQEQEQQYDDNQEYDNQEYDDNQQYDEQQYGDDDQQQYGDDNNQQYDEYNQENEQEQEQDNGATNPFGDYSNDQQQQQATNPFADPDEPVQVNGNY